MNTKILETLNKTFLNPKGETRGSFFKLVSKKLRRVTQKDVDKKREKSIDETILFLRSAAEIV